MTRTGGSRNTETGWIVAAAGAGGGWRGAALPAVTDAPLSVVTSRLNYQGSSLSGPHTTPADILEITRNKALRRAATASTQAGNLAQAG